MSGTPALAVSYCAHNQHRYEATAKLAMRVMDWMQQHPLPRGCIYNLNVPDLPYEEIKGVRAATTARTYMDSPNYNEAEVDGTIVYTYTHGVDSVAVDDPECDVIATQNGYASLTKLTWDLRMSAPDPDTSDIRL